MTDEPSAKGRRKRAERAGRLVEDLTLLLYLCLGFRPLARRLRTPVGEIDLLVKRRRLVVAVEVKYRASRDIAAWSITARNRRRIVDATRWWLASEMAGPADAECAIRFDAVLWAPWSRPRRIVGAFEAQE